jgi:eukaryotic-like serine/threonine-protein kinase
MLDPVRFRLIDELFDRALQLPPAERAAFIAEAAGADHDLAAEVAGLLASVTTSEAAVGESVADFAAPLLADLAADDAAESIGEIGPWRVLGQLGRGGMGAVYLAERSDGAYERNVAIKVVKLGMDTVELLRRFADERRILASLDHPNIARFIDAGSTTDGRPYLVLEHVEGERIDRWCDGRTLPVADRVRLFRLVCEAVHQAHSRLVVHRDIKPTNVLVTAAGVPKLLDFGIAKLLLADDATATSTGWRMLTPEYAAPEQIAGNAVTTATDVYALGRLLSELLTGARPGEQPADRAAVAAARGTTPDRLRAAVRGDLDTIIRRATAPDPERRYSSALQLAEDLERWATGMPVAARPDSAAYRGGKFVRRHRIGVSAAAIALLALAGFSSAMTASQRATAVALTRAEDERDTAEQTATLLEGLFAAGDPTAPRPERLDTFRVAALLDRGAVRVRADLADRPAVQARLLRAIGDAYRGLGLIEPADTMLRAAVTAQRTTDDPLNLAQALTSLGRLELNRGRAADAEPLFREALQLRDGRLEAAHPDAIYARTNLAASLLDQGNFPAAAALYDDALAELDAASAPDTASLTIVLNGRATVANRTGDNETALRLAERILDMDRARFGAVHARVAVDLNNVALMLMRLGHLAEADSMQTAAVDMLRATVGDRHPMYFNGVGVLSRVRSRRGQHENSRRLLEDAIAAQRALPVPPGPEFAVNLSHYAETLEALALHAPAEGAAVEALAENRRIFGDVHPAVAITLGQVARIRCARGAVTEAAGTFGDALKMLESTTSPSNPRLATMREELRVCTAR